MRGPLIRIRGIRGKQTEPENFKQQFDSSIFDSHKQASIYSNKHFVGGKRIIQITLSVCFNCKLSEHLSLPRALVIIEKPIFITFRQSPDLHLLRVQILEEGEELLLGGAGEDGPEIGDVRLGIVKVLQEGQAVRQAGENRELALKHCK